MAIVQGAVEIRQRFETERDYIQQYVEFLLLRASIDDSRIFELNKTLRGYRLPKLLTRGYERAGTDFSSAEIDALVASIDEVTPAVREALRAWEEKQTRRRPLVTPRGTTLEHGDLFDEWVVYLMQQLRREPRPKEIENVRRVALREATEQTDRAEGVSDEVLENVVHDALDTVLYIKRQAKEGALQNALDHFAELRIIARVGTPHAEINALRQGFILLMTVFDAAIFDLMRLKLRRDFFGLIGEFGNKEKVSFVQIGEAGSFDVFRDRVIEEQLRRRFVKDLLFILRHLGIACTDEANGDQFVMLVELVLRRNIHVHNRGVVDEKYLEKDKNDGVQYNIYDFQLGDVAAVDSEYWDRAIRLSTECVARVTAWVDA
jgi:hypothetical protein